MTDKNLKGLVFHIVHGSFVDGYGIRTTVFLKGCPLKCIWCCNPEGQSFKRELKLTQDNCTACGRCVKHCSKQALKLEGDKLVIDRSLCDACGDCVDYCFTDALDFYGEYYTVDELYNLVKGDLSFYKNSGGGVTIGGGEATWQPEFLMAFMNKLHENGINVAVDTCGYVTSPLGVECLKTADLLLFDLKGLDPSAHLHNTGVDNKVILDNLKMLNDMRQHIIVRLPIIPGYTDSEENLKATAELLASLKSVERVDILPVHHFGKVKYDHIGMDYKLEDCSISKERQDALKEFFCSYGLNAQIGG